MPRPIIVGFDGSEHSRDALVLAGEIASALASRLIIVNAYTPEEWLWAPGTAQPLDQEACGRIEAAAEAELSDSDRYELRSLPSPSAAGALYATAESEDAQMIVVGSTRRSRVGGAVLGTVTQAVLDASPCAVLVAPTGLADRKPISLRRIGVGFDDTPEAHNALAVASALAGRTGGTLNIVWAAHLVARTLPFAFAGYLEPNYFETVRREVEGRLDCAADQVRGELPVRTELANGDTVDALVDRSAHLDLLVLGSRGYGPLKRVLTGSVSRAVVNRARCPILVIGRGVTSLDDGSEAAVGREGATV